MESSLTVATTMETFLTVPLYGANLWYLIQF